MGEVRKRTKRTRNPIRHPWDWARMLAERSPFGYIGAVVGTAYGLFAAGVLLEERWGLPPWTPEVLGLVGCGGLLLAVAPRWFRHTSNVRKRAAQLGRLAAILLFAAAVVWWWDSSIAPRTVVVNLLGSPVQLGDNVFRPDGLLEPIPTTHPSLQISEGLILFDKRSGTFQSRGLSGPETVALNDVSRLLEGLDYSSYRHVRVVQVEHARDALGQYLRHPFAVPIGSDRYLVWSTDAGNYHLELAPFGLSRNVNLEEAASRAGVPLDLYAPVSATVSFSLASGGAPAGRALGVRVYAGGSWFDLASSLQTRGPAQREVVAIDLSSGARSLFGTTFPVMVFTLPIVEDSPRPLGGSEASLEGEVTPVRPAPVHFRDLLIHDITIAVTMKPRTVLGVRIR